MTWREIADDQRLRMAGLMLSQQGEITELRAALDAANRTIHTQAAESQLLADQRDAVLAYLRNLEPAAAVEPYLAIVIGHLHQIFITDPKDAP